MSVVGADGVLASPNMSKAGAMPLFDLKPTGRERLPEPRSRDAPREVDLLRDPFVVR